MESSSDPIAALSRKFQVPAQKVEEVYSAQRERLSIDARIDEFITILAIRNARAILRASGLPRVSHSHDNLDSDED